ncbi:cold-shock protein [Larsenimonas salina]|uniref:cold-shock protein n=1 Tax=Larsenimonas salina TaxID=1295565 RepID=UPI00255CF122|nr:cold shock domain-containing protein [Larsenimonas salina]
MNRQSFLRCSLISAVLALLLPFLILGLLMLFGSASPAGELMSAPAYLATAIAGFIVLIIATASMSRPAPRSVTSTAIEADDDDRESGIVKWFNVNKGYGFITRDVGGDEDVFVHFRALRGKGNRTLAEGQRVKYYAVRNDRGLQAEDVTVIT